MRPVVRGPRPKDESGKDISFSKYEQARGELISRLGEYCSYCEMHLDASLAVEHVKPKKPPGASLIIKERELEWDNFLLACTNCNSAKGNSEVDLNDYLWPDRDNTFLAFTYGEGGVVTPGDELSEETRAAAARTIKLTGLDKCPSNDNTASDRRWANRREAWDIAQLSAQNLLKCNTEEMRNQIILNARSNGYWSIWMTVFGKDVDMVKRLIQGFSGTCVDCFNPNDSYKPMAREGGQI